MARKKEEVVEEVVEEVAEEVVEEVAEEVAEEVSILVTVEDQLRKEEELYLKAKQTLDEHLDIEEARRIVQRKEAEERRLLAMQRRQQRIEERETKVEEAELIAEKAFASLDAIIQEAEKAEQAFLELDEFLRNNKAITGNLNRDGVISSLFKRKYPNRENRQGVLQKAFYAVLKRHKSILRSR